MALSNLKAWLDADLHTVWETVTDLTEYAWRSDLSRIENISPGVFVEVTKDGYETTFTITALEPESRYGFTMENTRMQGRWTGVFTEENGKTLVDLTEDVTAKKAVLRPFVKGYLKKQQAAYLADLQKALKAKRAREK